MAYTDIATRVDGVDGNASIDINSLMGNTDYFKDAITVTSGSVGINTDPAYKFDTVLSGASLGGSLYSVGAFGVKDTTTPAIDGLGALLHFTLEDDDAVKNIMGSIGFRRDGADDTGEYIIRAGAGDSFAEWVTISGGDAWFIADVSALTFTDRTPFFEGDALAEIKLISGNNGEIDHDTLPEFAKVKKIKKVDGEDIEEDGRDIGAMISILTVGMQQIIERLEILEG